MKKETKKATKKSKRRKRVNFLYLICWLVIPFAVIAILILDALGLYLFNEERLLVIGACVLVVLIPFFSEIRVKSISLKRSKSKR